MRITSLTIASSMVAVLAMAPDAHAQLNEATLGDLRFEMVFSSTSGMRNDPAKQEEIRRGIDLALRMWQSIVPQLKYRWVSTGGNVRIEFGRYEPPVNPQRSYNACPQTFGPWTACSFFPGPGGNLPTDPNFPGQPTVIWFNDKGRDNAGAGTYAFSFDAFTSVTRQSAYQNYEPAMLPPSYYNVEANNPGFLSGRFRDASRLIEFGEDIVPQFFHEWGHSMGMGHYNYVASDYITWYGQATATQNGSGFTNPALPATYYGAGTCTRVPFTRGTPPVTVQACNDDGNPGGATSPKAPGPSTLQPMHPVAHTHYGSNASNVPPTGIPVPPFSRYNNRVVFNADISPDRGLRYRWSFPEITGVIRLVRGASAYLTSDWYAATREAQLRAASQNNPYLVSEIFPLTNSQWSLGAGNNHSLALQRDGTLWTWGANNLGQIGNGTTSSHVIAPVNVNAANSSLPRFAAVSTSNCHNLALAQDGRIFGNGCNDSGRIGTGDTANKTRPTQICNDSTRTQCYSNRYAVVVAGGDSSLAIRTDGTLWSWGAGDQGQLGHGLWQGRTWPGPVGTDNDWVTVAASAAYHAMGIRRDGSLWGWGANYFGQLGTDDFGNRESPTPADDGSRDWVSVAMGWNVSYAIRADGSLWSAGSNSQGELGRTDVSLGDSDPRFRQIGADRDWVAVAGGYCHALALKANGTLWAWGCNDAGQVGDNTITTRLTPVRVCDKAATPCTYNNRYTSIEAGGGHSLAVRRDGWLHSWGVNDVGQLGFGGSNRRAPVQSTFRQNVIGVTSATSPANVNLTSEGFADWIRWTTYASPIRKHTYTAGNGPLNMAVLNSTNVTTFSSSAVNFAWTMDGRHPNVNGSSSNAGLRLTTTSDRFAVTAPARPAKQVLKLYVAADRATAQLRVSISDGSSAAVTQSVTNETGVSNRVYTITFSSGADDATLTAEWRMTTRFGSGHVRLQSATLQ